MIPDAPAQLVAQQAVALNCESAFDVDVDAVSLKLVNDCCRIRDQRLRSKAGFRHPPIDGRFPTLRVKGR